MSAAVYSPNAMAGRAGAVRAGERPPTKPHADQPQRHGDDGAGESVAGAEATGGVGAVHPADNHTDQPHERRPPPGRQRANNGAAGSGKPGRGILGMRERCQLLGGELDASPLEGGGFAVTARLPLAPKRNGEHMTATTGVPNNGAPIKVLLVDDEHLVRSGFKLLLDTENDITVVGEATTGESLLAPRITRRLIAQFTAQRTASQAAQQRLSVLTQREREILALVGHGMSNDEIGAELVLSPATARTHVSHAMVKLVARDRAQLVVIAYPAVLVTP